MSVRAALVTVGDELLLGQTVDTNAAWLGRRLADLGIPVPMHVDSFRQATAESATFFGADKVNYMRRLARTLKECQDA